MTLRPDPQRQKEIEQALDLLTRRPRLIEALFAIHEMTEGKRTCRLSLDIQNGSLRIFSESLRRSIPLDPPAPMPPAG